MKHILAVLLLCATGWGEAFRYENVELLRVIDGDTVVLRMEVAPDIYAVRPCRLLGINAPELRSKDSSEKAAAMAAKLALTGFLAGKQLVVSLDKTDDFGRWIVNLAADGKDVSQWELEQKIAVQYR